MIDTIRFKAPLSEHMIEQLKQLGEEIFKIDHKTGQTVFRISSGDIRLPSYERDIHISTSDKTMEATIEFSVPKALLGHNIHMLSGASILKVLQELQDTIRKTVPGFPAYKHWRVTRLDLCHAWKLDTQAEAQAAIDDYKRIFRARKQAGVSYFETAFQVKQVTYTHKMYLKLPEFQLHDGKQLMKLKQFDEALKLEELAAGVIRYEITLRHHAVEYLFGYHATIEEILLHDLPSITNQYFSKLITGLEAKNMTIDDIRERLVKQYGQAKAIRLYQFYTMDMSPDPKDREFLEKSFDRSTIWRNRRDIKKANIGINSITKKFNFSIPSIFSVKTI